ncbi:FAD-binding protein [Simiduia sp. 21SJ11W-1]|uniref:FAD-linked oxidase C-terminal domain-containing protein n=1 Tax=Simiduia sp. 21SJ11W-1 TaxID=2909669 RepID=UPI00209EA3BD|nr:FAD-linked oxidase C-terminal domain-containing protein [Simiduia sp. 21SJ11W-1]UTA48411.1 FAD-binding protein [Simiduia sp. 21SJ11W-1]
MLAELIQTLRAQLPAECLLTEPEQRVAFECDALSVYTALPGLVVLARSEADVVAVVKACATHKVPLVSRGAGTGLSAGALPHPDGVLLVTARMNRILSLNAQTLTARVQPGVINARISEAAQSHQCYYAPDPSSQIACSIGGNVAENAGGVHCLKYGVTVNNVIGARVVNASGQLVELGGQTAAQPGFDLLALVHGSEGCLGVVTEITLRLTPLPETTRTLLAEFSDVRSACDAVSEVIASGVIPAALEMMDALAIRATEAFCQPGYGAEAQAVLLVDLDGDPAEVRVECELTRELLTRAGARQVREASTEAERLRWWKGRKSAFPAIGRLSPDYYCIDGTVPRGKIGDLLDFIGQAALRYQLQVANVFHAGDGNLHPIIMFDNSKPGELARTEQLAGEILEACIAAGGTITGEHGVGVEKIRQMASQFSEPEIAQLLALKAALDEHNLLNPDKLIPSLARCREYRLLKQQ